MSSKVYALADELQKEFSEIIEFARSQGIRVSSHMNTISWEEKELIVNAFTEQEEEEARSAEEEASRLAEEERHAEEAVQMEREADELRAKAEAARSAIHEAASAGMSTAAPVPEARSTRHATASAERVDLGTSNRHKRPTPTPARTPNQRTSKTSKKTSRHQPEKPLVRKTIEVQLPITLKDLSQSLGIKANVIIQRLLIEHGFMLRINDVLSEDVIETVALEFDQEILLKQKKKTIEQVVKDQVTRVIDRPEDMVPRTPVVAVLGHVDHGKTSILDYIRRTKVADSEAGGITQNIKAWSVQTERGQLTFLDTPGHQAFTEMRSRGAQATDICVLVVAADDGVMPQTVEAINHAQAAGTPIVVAINKIDKANAQIDKTKSQLAQHGLTPSEWGGDTEMVLVSAIQGEGIDLLLENILLVTAMLELKSNPNKPATGVVIEASRSEGRGIVADVLVQNGTLRKGDIVLLDVAYGKVRSMTNFAGIRVEEAGPSTPASITGLDAVPAAGEKFYVFDDAAQAKQVAEQRKRAARMDELAEPGVTRRLENIFDQIQAGQAKGLNIVIKAEVQGSIEVLRKSLLELATDEIGIDIKHSGVGAVNERDVLLAHASDAIIVAFNVIPDPRARSLAEEKRVDIRRYNVIYNVLDEVKQAMQGLLDPELHEVTLGYAEIRQVFTGSRIGRVAGCFVVHGKIERKSSVRLLRDNIVIWSGQIGSLRRIKDDVKEVRENLECGIRLQGFDDIKAGDVIEAYKVEETARTFS
ncbi:MAG: translation initiation factor IF-2 [Planctomycetota bacterium]|nr:translation initiation factor IF-2 [Planctomycetota bacterium]